MPFVVLASLLECPKNTIENPARELHMIGLGQLPVTSGDEFPRKHEVATADALLSGFRSVPVGLRHACLELLTHLDSDPEKTSPDYPSRPTLFSSACAARLPAWCCLIWNVLVLSHAFPHFLSSLLSQWGSAGDAVKFGRGVHRRKSRLVCCSGRSSSHAGPWDCLTIQRCADVGLCWSSVDNPPTFCTPPLDPLSDSRRSSLAATPKRPWLGSFGHLSSQLHVSLLFRPSD
ncbi:uncharacterized protein LY79DRAFT_127283 [Colletotrichum navitas]|uniref:Uncharacterized protein n=1 Tax=Colletotrichum navitas TaxID=681940 RepID=A0AAD8Q3G6_9PEZI|nr:uncharacterized protein LY79DRAFT_127283 [Colletotrichum navitas]KAK1594834.1 hypothetical protein LY79DRAFT_127283 [Colletotrichum navitas]